MTARQGNKTKYHIEEILKPAANNSLHFSSYWLLSNTCLGKDTESLFMTAHKNTEFSDSCSEHTSILPLKFSHKHLCFIPQIQQPVKAQSYIICPLGQESRLMEISGWLGHALCATNTSLWLLYARSHAACHVPTAEMLQMDQKPQSQLFSLPFDFSSDLGEPHNLSPNSLSPLDHPLPYVLYGCCEYKSHPILSHLESLLPNYFSQGAERVYFFFKGGERSRQQTT